jgi:tetratricopeptide (TPR) repeat protein
LLNNFFIIFNVEIKMNHQSNNYNTSPSQHFQDFLDGKLSEAEIHALFQRAEAADFKRRFKEKLAEIDNPVIKPPIEVVPIGRKNLGIRWAKAASVLLILGVGILFFYSSKPSYLELQERYAAEIPAYDNTKKGSDAVFDALEAGAKQAYARQDFKTAEQNLKQIIAKGKGDSDHYFYLGLCLSKTNPPFPKEAIQALTEAKKLRQGLLDGEICWYLALMYIQNKQLEEAKLELNALKGKYKSDEVQQLLNVLPTKE